MRYITISFSRVLPSVYRIQTLLFALINFSNFNVCFSSINNVDDDKFNVVVTSPDPVRPNELEILHHNGSNRRHFVFESNPGAPNRSSEDFGNPEGDTENSPSENWKFPHVAFSPSGVAEVIFFFIFHSHLDMWFRFCFPFFVL